MKANLVFLPGDGIGPEVMAAAAAVLEAVAARFGHTFETETHLVGGCAIDAYGIALADETLAACRRADAVLLGAVGGPKWDEPTAKVRPEQGLLALRKSLGLFANLRPVTPHPALLSASPIKSERLEGVDILVIRELTGGIYYGPRARTEVDGQPQAFDTMVYTRSEIERVCRLAFSLARQRRKKVTSVDKANVLDTSRLWRQTVTEVAHDFPEVTLEHLLVDAAAMHLLTRPASFDVMVMENMFGDILTDEASVLSGSLGNLPSASLGDSMPGSGQNALGLPRGLYEPIHGSAPDIAGKGIANPTGTILSLALALRHSLGLEDEARVIEAAVSKALDAGARTADLAAPGQPALSTQKMLTQITAHL